MFSYRRGCDTVKKWVFNGLIVGFFAMFCWNLYLAKSNSDLKSYAGRHYEEYTRELSSVVLGTINLKFEELVKTEDGKQIIADNVSAFDRIGMKFMWNEPVLARVSKVANDISMLEWTLLDNGEWTPEEKELHSKALRTLRMISIDFDSIEGTKKHWYKLFTEEDSELIEKIEQRAEAQAYEL